MRRLIYFIAIINFFLICLPANSYCYAAESKLELNWDYLTPHSSDRDLDTVSLHILEKISEKKSKSIYRGITITRPRGDVTLKYREPQDSSAVGIGPIYMIRDEKYHSGKLAAALEMSGGVILDDKVFPAGGRYYNFMWRIGPTFSYKISEDSSLNLGYMFMHVSNGFKTHNPGYDAHGVSFGFVTKF